jgi:hypothetical protein
MIKYRHKKSQSSNNQAFNLEGFLLFEMKLVSFITDQLTITFTVIFGTPKDDFFYIGQTFSIFLPYY